MSTSPLSDAFDGRFADLIALKAAIDTSPKADAAAEAAAAARNGVLTKPPGALGRLETIGIWLASWQGKAKPAIAAPHVLIFAGNHGVVAQGVSAFPSEVTAQMTANFDAGGAAINQLAGVAGAALSVTALDLETPTADFTDAPAMTEAELLDAVAAGWRAVPAGADLIAVGEMGIGNTTAAAAIAGALFGGESPRPEEWTGAGTSPDGATIPAKNRALALAFDRHAGALSDPLEVLRRLGGRELAAIAGAVLGARHRRIPVLLDGFIATAAAAPLAVAAPGALAHCLASHRSAEAAHGRLLEALGLEPLLDLGLRLGEGSGAALSIPVVKAAAACLSGMASFDEAAVSEKTG